MTEQAEQVEEHIEDTATHQEDPGQSNDQATAEPAAADPGFVETENERVQARINKITAEKYAEKRRAEELERLLAEARSKIPPMPPASNEPKLEDYDYDEQKYQAALIDHKVNQKAQEIQEQAQRAQQERDAQATQQLFNQRAAKVREKVPDYDQLMMSIPPLPDETFNAILAHEKGPEIAVHLAKHLDVADEIATMSPSQAGMKLGMIISQLSEKPVSTSQAPDPIEPISQAGTGIADEWDKVGEGATYE